MRKLADGIFCEIGWDGANVGAVEGDEGLALVDSPMLPRDAREWKEQLAEVSRKAPIYMVNTDYHFDHIMTDCMLCERVVAHSLAEPAFLTQSGEVFEQLVSAFFPDIDEASRAEIRELRSVAPHIIFTESLSLALGSRRIEIKRLGGHTPATSVVHVPSEGIIFTGDIHVHDRHPFQGDANLLEWIEALHAIQGMDAGTVVPGHGEVCDLESVGRLKEYFEDMRGRVGDLVGQGCAREEVEKRVDMLPFFPVEEGKETATESFIKLGIGRMYDQLTESSGK